MILSNALIYDFELSFVLEINDFNVELHSWMYALQLK